MLYMPFEIKNLFGFPSVLLVSTLGYLDKSKFVESDTSHNKECWIGAISLQSYPTSVNNKSGSENELLQGSEGMLYMKFRDGTEVEKKGKPLILSKRVKNGEIRPRSSGIII